jgi:hypothetical protein
MFEKSLQDLVKGIRNNKNDPSAYIAACVAEIKAELRSRDSDLKAQVGVRGALDLSACRHRPAVVRCSLMRCV